MAKQTLVTESAKECFFSFNLLVIITVINKGKHSNLQFILILCDI